MQNIHVVDLCQDRSFDSLWYEEIDKIKDSNDNLKHNYTSIQFSDFESFTMLVSGNSVVAFSGLQFLPERWGRQTARVLSRFYISPEYRHGSTLLTDDLYTEYMLPTQISIARGMGLSSVFISRQHGLMSFGKFISQVNDTIRDTNFELLNGRYDICGIEKPVPESCKQFIALKQLTENGKREWNSKMLFRRFS